MPRFVDLSAPIAPSPAELPDVPAHRPSSSSSTRTAPREIEATVRRPGAAAARRRGLGGRDVHALRHAQLDPRRRAVPLQLDDPRASRRRRSTSCRSSGSSRPASCSTSPRRDDGDAVDAPSRGRRSPRAGHELRERDIVLVRTAATRSTPSPTTCSAAPASPPRRRTGCSTAACA